MTQNQTSHRFSPTPSPTDQTLVVDSFPGLQVHSTREKCIFQLCCSSVIINTSIRKNDKAMDIFHIRNMEGTPSSKILFNFFSCIMLGHPTHRQSLQRSYPCSWFVIIDDDDNDDDITNTLFQVFHEVGTWSLVVSVQQDIRVKRVPPRLSSKHDWKWLLSAQVRSLSVLVTHWLTD